MTEPTDAMTKDEAVALRLVLSLMETHVLVPRELAEFARDACDVAADALDQEAKYCLDAGKLDAEAGLRVRSAAYKRTADYLYAALKEDNPNV